MAYRISKGIKENELSQWLKNAAKKYGTFEDERVNYTKADIAPVVMCTVICQNKILLAKRGYGLADAEGYWSTINGFIDQDKPVRDIASQELHEELGLDIPPQVIKVARSYTIKNPKEKRSYIIFPCLIKLDTKPEIILDREHTDFVWINRDELEQYHMLDDTFEAIDAALLLN